MRTDSVLVSYAIWLANHGEGESDLLPLIQGIGFNSKEELKLFLEHQLEPADSPNFVRFDAKFPFLDNITLDYFAAIAKYNELAKREDDVLVDFMLWAIKNFPLWTLDRHTSASQLLEIYSYSVLEGLCERSAGPNYCRKVFNIFDEISQSFVASANDVEVRFKALGGILSGMVRAVDKVHVQLLPKISTTTTTLLSSNVFDLREFLLGVPSNACVDEVLQRHYILLHPLLAFVSQVLKFQPEDNIVDAKESLLTLREVLDEYYTSIIQFLSRTSSTESFLYTIISLSSEILCETIRLYGENIKETGEFIGSALKSFNSADNIEQFGNILEPSCQLLYCCAEKAPEFQIDCVSILKQLLIVFAKHNNEVAFTQYNQAIVVIAKYIGMTLKLLIAQDKRVFCESFVSNLTVEIPTSANQDYAYSSIINAFGSISMGVADDKIIKICLSSLTAQFKTKSTICPVIFFEQFNLIASSGPIPFLNAVLDIYVDRYGNVENMNQSLQIAQSLKALVLLNLKDHDKTEIILQAILRLFVDRGLSIVNSKLGKHKKKDQVLPPPLELEYLLPALTAILENYPITTSEPRFNPEVVRLELFQEFWFVLIFTGFQCSISWPENWAPHIPILASATPVLVKDTDRLKEVTAPFSKVLLTQPVNANLKSALMNLMPQSGNMSKYLTLPKLLWLLSLFVCETPKLRNGNLRDLLTYLSSDVVEHFELGMFVEDLVNTMVKRWITEVTVADQAIIDSYACILVDFCCHSQSKVHNFSLRFLKMILDNHKLTYSSHALWEAMLQKIGSQYEICRRDVGEIVLNRTQVMEETFYNPSYDRVTFESVLNVARRIFSAASVEYPHDFFSFIQKNLKVNGNSHSEFAGERDIRVLELLRICIPVRTESIINYLGLPLEFHGKPEDHLKWLMLKEKLCSSNSECSDCPQFFLADPKEINGQNLLHLLFCTCNSLIADSFKMPRSAMFEKIIDGPMAVMSSLSIKNATYCWAWLMESRPELSGEWLVYMINGWKKHVQLQQGAFGISSSVPVFRKKMNTAPSAITQIIPESSLSVPYIVLLDYIHERLLLSCRRSKDEVFLFYKLIVEILSSMKSLVGLPKLRPAIFKAASLGLEFLRQNDNLPYWKNNHLRSLIYELLIKLFEQQNGGFLVEDQNFLRYYESLLVKLRNFMSEEREVMSNFVKRNNDIHRHLPQVARFTNASEVLRAIFNSEWEKSLIWSNRLKNRQFYVSEANGIDLVKKAFSLSPLLAIRIMEHLTYIPTNNIVKHLEGLSDVSFSNVAIVDTLIQNNIEFKNRQLIYAPSEYFISAIDLLRNPSFAKKPIFSNYAMRSMETCSPETLYFYIPHLVQALRHDLYGYTERTIMHIARSSSLFAHQIIWNMKANCYQDDNGTVPDPCKDKFEEVINKITRLLAGIAREFYDREFNFFEKVTNISRTLKPFVKAEKWEKKAKIDEELAKIVVDPGVYLPSNPESIVVGIDYKSGRPLQSHAKTPFMATFMVKSDELDPEPVAQSVIFKVGDDCRQDVLALQLITTLKNIFESIGLNLYYFPYRVVATAPGSGVIEVIPNSISRDQLGREKINSLYEYFLFKFGNEKSVAFQKARENFIKSMAAYSLAGYLFAIKDRHNGNIMVSDFGHIIHIDFGFILDISPGGISMESPFKLTTEMLQVMGGKDESAYFLWYRNLAIQGFLACRQYADKIIELVQVMKESGLPCFKGDSTLRKLRARFRLDLNDADAREFFNDLIYKSCETFRTAMYDRYQERTNGIPY